MNLANSQMPKVEPDGLPQHYVPQQLKLSITDSLVELLHGKFVGKKVEVGTPGAKGYSDYWSGIIVGIAEHNGQLFIFFEDVVIPFHQIRFIRTEEEITNKS